MDPLGNRTKPPSHHLHALEPSAPGSLARSSEAPSVEGAAGDHRRGLVAQAGGAVAGGRAVRPSGYQVIGAPSSETFHICDSKLTCHRLLKKENKEKQLFFVGFSGVDFGYISHL